jgi:hypothetical protein
MAASAFLRFELVFLRARLDCSWFGNKAQISPPQDAQNYEMVLPPGFLVRCVLRCSYPLSSAEGGAFRLGVAQPRAAQRRRGGRRGRNDPAPANFAQFMGGRGPLGLLGGPNGPKNGPLCAAGRSEMSKRVNNNNKPQKKTRCLAPNPAITGLRDFLSSLGARQPGTAGPCR